MQDVSEFNVIIETPPGSNLDYTKLKAEEVARLARSRPEVAYTYATIGGSGGLGSASGAVDEANVYVRLVPEARAGDSTRRSWRRSCGGSWPGSAA